MTRKVKHVRICPACGAHLAQGYTGHQCRDIDEHDRQTLGSGGYQKTSHIKGEDDGQI